MLRPQTIKTASWSRRKRLYCNCTVWFSQCQCLHTCCFRLCRRRSIARLRRSLGVTDVERSLFIEWCHYVITDCQSHHSTYDSFLIFDDTRMITGHQTAGWGHGKTFVRFLQCKHIGGPVELRDVSGSQASRCIVSDTTTIRTLWLVATALILI
jgi:hypothetical protein